MAGQGDALAPDDLTAIHDALLAEDVRYDAWASARFDRAVIRPGALLEQPEVLGWRRRARRLQR